MAREMTLKYMYKIQYIAPTIIKIFLNILDDVVHLTILLTI